MRLAVQAETRAMTLEEKVDEIKTLQTHGGDRKSEDFQSNDSNLEIRGNASRYQIARLKRDHPTIAEALARGEYPSVRAAAQAAGLVRQPPPLEDLHRIWRKVSPEDRARFLLEMLTAAEKALPPVRYRCAPDNLPPLATTRKAILGLQRWEA